jgi:hypothetical protein
LFFWNAVDPGDDNAWTEVPGSATSWNEQVPGPGNSWTNIAA